MARILMSWNWTRWPRFMLYLAATDLSGWYSLMCRLCSLIPV